MGSLEVVSKETFQQQLEAMSSCVSCQKERLKEVAHRKLSRRTRKGGHIKSNSPIVVRLRDTIKVSVRGKLKETMMLSSDQDSDLSSDESSIPSAGTCSSQQSSTGVTPPESPRERTYKKVKGSRISRIRRSRKDGKNFNAFLSAIEKVHSKERGIHLFNNLNQYTWHSKEYKNLAHAGFNAHGSDLLLNNAVAAAAYQSSITTTFLRGLSGSSSGGQLPPESCHHHICSKPKAFQSINKDNVDLICNDLTSESGVRGFTTNNEDADNFESASVASSSDTQSESDGSSGGEITGEELTEEELEKLRGFTTGCPLTRYSCPPHECPECLAAYYAYTHYFAQGNDFLKLDTLNHEDKEKNKVKEREGKKAATTGTETNQIHCKSEVTQVSMTETLPSPDTRTKKRISKQGKPKKVEVSVAAFLAKPMKKRMHEAPPTNQCFDRVDTVTIDITDSDVTYSVSYPCSSSEESDEDSDPEAQTGYGTMTPGWPNNYNDFYHSFYATMLGFMPFLIPAYWIPPYYPWACPTVAVSRPLKETSKCPSSTRSTQTQEQRLFTCTQPPQRPWIPLAHPDTTKPVAIYTVMCYNILCDKYATRQLYGYCPSWALNWEYRKKIIIEEIRQYSADIISLQEVETEQFYNYFLPELKTNGYDGVFAAKSRARTMSEGERKHVDGCAIFYQTAKFSLIKDYLVEFNQMAISTADGSHDMINRVMTKDNIGLAALLETKEGVWENGLPAENLVCQPILVATCHVHWDPEFCDVKLIQTMMLMSELKNVIQDTQMSLRPGSTAPDCNTIPLILCGDLNSLPDSGVVDFLNMGRVSAQHEDFKGLGYEDCLRKLSVSDNKDMYTHGFKLTQAYKKDVMPYTNYTFDFKGVIDYIFYSRDFMQPLGVLGPLDQDWFEENKVYGCPHPQIPSDHLPLLTEFEMAAPSPSNNSGSSSSGSGNTSSSVNNNNNNSSSSNPSNNSSSSDNRRTMSQSVGRR